MNEIVFILNKRRHFIFPTCVKTVALIAAISLLQLSVPAQDQQAKMSAKTNKAISTKSFTIHQEIDFKASPEQVYKALLDSKEFSEFAAKTGPFSATSAKIDPVVGGVFSVFDGHIIGRILELVPNQRIVQAWRVVDWPSGLHSIAKFEIKPKGSGTHLVFDHTGFPPDLHDHLAEGWRSHYWDP
ncbi:MAG TPA: SRPBCC family protein, partial [Puia sp.]|nr:SRPBCC family protein [Puia sp.]